MSLSAAQTSPLGADALGLAPHRRGTPAEPHGARLAGAAARRAAPAALPLARDARGRPRWTAPLRGRRLQLEPQRRWPADRPRRGVQVGVDLERLRPRARALELAQRFFTARGGRAGSRRAAAAVRDHAFLRLWCAKEAVLKAHGHGIWRSAWTGWRFEDGATRPATWPPATPPWARRRTGRCRSSQPGAGYLGAIAWRPRL